MRRLQTSEVTPFCAAVNSKRNQVNNQAEAASIQAAKNAAILQAQAGENCGQNTKRIYLSGRFCCEDFRVHAGPVSNC